MKKLISYVLLLAMCLALFAGCAPKTEADPGLDSAKTYLYNMYKDTAKTTKASYDVVGMVVIQGVGTYNVEWTVNSDAITVTPNGKMVTIGIPEYPEAEINYTLTATIKDDKGNTASVAFDHNVPKAAGQPATLADGTYVIASGNLTMSSLTEDKSYGYPTANEVTIADGKVSNHFKADVLTIKNVEGGVTIQDAYGRYFYLKGTYNSFNVDATMPAEGHIFTVLKSGDSYLIVNAMNKKTLAYSTSYTSWGCYPELTEEHQTALTIVPATAPATDPVKPDEGGNDTPSTGDSITGTLASSIANGDKVIIFYPDSNLAVSATASGSKLSGVEATVSGSTLTTTGAAVLEVTVDANGNYTFTCGGKYLTAGETGNSLTLADAASNYSLWTLETADNGFYIKNVNAKFGENAQYLEYYSGFTTYGFNNSKANIYTYQFFKTDAASTGGSTTTPDTGNNNTSTGSNTGDVTLTNGMKVVIYAPGHGKALSSKPSSEGSYYQMGVDVTVSGSTLTGYSDTEVWTVIDNGDGTFSFEQGGKKIGMQAEFSSMSLGAVNDKWEVISLGDGLYNIKNTVRGNMIEWYSSKNNWSTYTSSKAATDPLFQMSFYVVK